MILLFTLPNVPNQTKSTKIILKSTQTFNVKPIIPLIEWFSPHDYLQTSIQNIFALINTVTDMPYHKIHSVTDLLQKLKTSCFYHS